LRILHVSPSFYPAWAYGGIPRCAYELCRALVRLGDEVTVWTTDAGDAAHRLPERTAIIDGIEIRRFRNLSNRLAYHLQLYLPLGLAAQARAGVGGFDLVHIHSHRHLLEAVVSRAARRMAKPYVCTANGTAPAIERHLSAKRLVDRLGARDILREAAACIAVSHAEIAHYQQVGVAPESVKVIPNGLRLEEYEDLPIRGGFRRRYGVGVSAPLVVFVGKITPRKGVDVLLRALPLLPPEVELAVVGNFMMPQEQLRRLARDLGVERRVRFTGLLTGSDKLSAYVDADVVAYPSVDEIFGLVPAEALMCGAPVVVCDDSGCGELVRAAQGGLLVPYGDAPALAQALRRLLDDTELRARCVTSGRRYAREDLGWERIAAETQALYHEILDRPEQARCEETSPGHAPAVAGQGGA